jgi:hypothetical protein
VAPATPVTVTVWLPGVVPGMAFALFAFAPPPHPTAIAEATAIGSNMNKVFHLLLRTGTPKRSKAERIIPPRTEPARLRVM